MVVQTLPSLLYFLSVLVGFANEVGYPIAFTIAALGAVVIFAVAKRAVQKAAPPLHPVCGAGPYKAEPGEQLGIFLDAKRGQRVKGHVEEVTGQTFDWYIADEKNKVHLKNGDMKEFTFIDDGHEKKAYRVNRKIPYPARWYLIIDMYQKKASRKVRVDFEHIPVQTT